LSISPSGLSRISGISGISGKSGKSGIFPHVATVAVLARIETQADYFEE